MVSTLLMGQHVALHYQAIDNSYEDIRSIIDAHEIEMDETMEEYGIVHVRKMLSELSGNIHDKHLYLLLKEKDALTGNLAAWPQIDLSGKDYIEIKLPQKEGKPLHLLVSLSRYDDGSILFVGYDLERIDAMRHDLWRSLFENLILALLAASMASTVIVWLLSRHFRQFNIACDRVMMGNLDHRIATSGAEDEFDRLASNLNRMLDWIRALVRTVKDSSNAIAHDMRTPLSRLRLELRALAERPRLNDETRQAVLTHVERVDGLIAMFENILNIAKAESRSSTELFEPVDMRQLVQDVLDFYAPMLEEKHLTLQKSLTAGTLTIRADKQLLGQAVVNLIDNACKYTPSGGKINVRLSSSNAIAALEVSDSGQGIPEGLRERAKEPFFRTDESRNTDGHGLGLSLVNAVAGLHQGTLTLADNAPGLRVILTIKRGNHA